MLGGFAFFLSSCNKEAPKDEVRKTITLSLGFSGDISVTNEPLTKGTATNDLYGINVYYSSDGEQYTHLSYGVFDNKEDMTISLLTGYYYKFECSLVKDARTMLYNSIDTYYYPFQTASSISSAVTNSFVNSSTVYLSGLLSGSAHLKGLSYTPTKTNATNYPSIDRFYGVVSGYVPVENGVVSIPLKRMVFGLKYSVSGMVDGCGTIEITNPTDTYSFVTNGDSDERLYSFYDIKSAYDADQGDITLNVKYIMNDSTWAGYLSSNEWNQTVTVKRNYLTTLSIALDFPKGTISFNTEETLIDDNNINIGIGSGGFIDVIVDPNE